MGALDQLIDAQDRIGEVQSESIELREENSRLRQQIADFDDWQTRLDQYRLITTDAGGHVYYGRAREGDPEHYVCPACVEKRLIQVLQDDRNVAGTYTCPSCKATYPVKPRDKRSSKVVVRW